MNKSKRKIILSILTLCLALVCTFCMPNQASAAKIKLSKKSVTITKGKSVTLKLKGTKKKPKWSSSNKKVATVSKKGKVTGKKAGNAKITAKVGKKKYVCKVKVVKAKANPQPVTDPNAPVVLNETNCEYVVQDGAVTIENYGYDKDWTSIVIPATLGGYPVKVVDGFVNHKKLTEVVISEGVEKIDSWSFQDCINLTKITIPSSVVNLAGRETGYDENDPGQDEYGRPNPMYGGIFGYCPLTTIYGKTGSFAEEFANKRGIPFNPIQK